MPTLREVQQKNAEERQKKLTELASTIKSGRIEYIISVILTEVRKERRLIMQILYTLLSSYTPEPLNLAINAPSGEGKSYGLNNVMKYFPKHDILSLAGMTERALFHRKGDIVVPEDDDVYVPIEKYTDDLKIKIEDLKDQLKEAEKNEKLTIRTQIHALEKEIEDVMSQAVKRIDLSNKSLIFQDTPKPELLEAIMPLLSHDQFRVFYEFASKNSNGIQTISNMLEGYPSVIYCQAIDTSNRERSPEIARRFIFVNPEMNEEKYKEAIDQTFKKTMSNTMYESEVVSNEEKDKVKGIILDLIQEIKLHCLDKENNIVLMPFLDALLSSFKSTSAFDMTVADKTKKFLALLPVVNIKERPYLLTDNEERIPFCIFKDLEDTTYLNEFLFGGLRQYILKWYVTVFYHVWNKKKLRGQDGLDTKVVGNRTLSEKRPVARMDELIDRTKETTKEENITQSSIRNKYLTSLINTGYIDEFNSEIDSKEKVFYPSALEIIDKYRVEGNELKMIKKIKITDERLFPSPRNLAPIIKHIVDSHVNSKIIDVDGTELTIDQLIEKYYNDSNKLFTLGHEQTQADIDRVTRANLPTSTMLDQFQEEVYDEVICEACGERLFENELSDHKNDCTPK